MKTLSIVESAYRATIEEQDDTIVWLTHAMKGAGADLAVLLRGNAVNYAVRAQDASGLACGDWRQTQPPKLAGDVEGLIGKGVSVYVLNEDLAARGLRADELVAGLRQIDGQALPGLLAQYDQVWHW